VLLLLFRILIFEGISLENELLLSGFLLMVAGLLVGVNFLCDAALVRLLGDPLSERPDSSSRSDRCRVFGNRTIVRRVSLLLWDRLNWMEVVGHLGHVYLATSVAVIWALDLGLAREDVAFVLGNAVMGLFLVVNYFYLSFTAARWLKASHSATILLL